MGGAILLYGLGALAFLVLASIVKIVPEQEAHVVETLGKYSKTMTAGLNFVIPGFQRVAYKQLLKEEVIDVEPQICITNDNVQVTVDGILYLKVMDPVKASYGIERYRYATAQLAKTTMRSEIGKLELDRTFSEREELNTAIVKAVDQASDPWGIKVTRYEIKDISPAPAILDSMEQQMRAEREKRAEILESEGDRTARVNISEGEREEAVNISKGERQKKINEATGRAKAIELTAQATAEGIREIGLALKSANGDKAMKLRIAEQYITQLGEIMNRANTSVLPTELASIKSVAQTLIAGLGDKGGK
jgi:regulator of protease activity HflC (stomatin/prohibitin superfamily)